MTEQWPQLAYIRQSREGGWFSKIHGMEGTPTYRSWLSMKARCFNPKALQYKYYGARGVKVCFEWLSFKNFFKDMGVRPSGKTLDRIDPNGNYEPDNCRWATITEQNRNTRRSIKITFNGQTLNVNDWAERVGLSAGNISQRIARGVDPEVALTAPIRMPKLSYEVKMKIKSEYQRNVIGSGIRSLARKYGISVTHARDIVRGHYG